LLYILFGGQVMDIVHTAALHWFTALRVQGTAPCMSGRQCIVLNYEQLQNIRGPRDSDVIY
jgi:hypothetical protein